MRGGTSVPRARPSTSSEQRRGSPGPAANCATGQPVAHDQRPDPVTLTPQQREIATLAAAGLTNEQIGERLYLSHRTLATHLYQIFPKLGVSSRAALRDALSGGEDREEPDR